MQTQAIKIIEPEVVLEEARSANHSRLIHRIYVAPLPYEDHYDSIPEFELAASRCKLSVASITKQAYTTKNRILCATSTRP